MKTFILCSPNRYFLCYRWASLCQCIDDVNATVKTMREGGDVKLQQHIGGGHYVSVTSGYRCVDIRLFFQPHGTEIKPTKRGVALRLDEWTTLSANTSTTSTRLFPLSALHSPVTTTTTTWPHIILLQILSTNFNNADLETYATMLLLLWVYILTWLFYGTQL